MKMFLMWFTMISFIYFVINYDLSMSESKIIGSYLHSEYINEHCSNDIPNRLDTLVLFKGGKLKSSFFGNGTYSLSLKQKTVNIVLTPESHNDYMIINTFMTNKLFQNYRIVLGCNMYYEKMD